MRDVMPLIAVNQRLNSYELKSDSYLRRYDRDFFQSLQLAMKKICSGGERLLDFAIVSFCVYEEFEDGIPTVEYEDLCEVIGQCHSAGFYYFEYDVDKDFDV